MKVTKRQLRRIIREMTQPDLPPSPRQWMSAVTALRQGESFSYPINAGDLNALLGASSSGEGIIHNPTMGLSGDAKLIMGIVGVIGVLILVAMALGYSVNVKGQRGDTSGEIVFTSPGDTDEGDVEVEDETRMDRL